jgi:hypothetical protein
MKQISEVEENLFTLSSNICLKACCGKSWVGLAVKRISCSLPSQSLDISFKDDVTVIFLLGVSFMDLI